jgi:hypothetical protein
MTTYPDIDFRNSMSSPTARDQANIFVQGVENFKSVSLPMITTNAAASLLAEWYLIEYSVPEGKLEGVLNRKAWKYQVGDLVRVTYPKLNLNKTVFRVANMSDSEIETGTIHVIMKEEKRGKVGEVTEFTTPTDLRISTTTYTYSGESAPESAFLYYQCNESPVFTIYDPVIIKNNEWYALTPGEMCDALIPSGELVASGEYVRGQRSGTITNAGWAWSGSGEVYINTSGELSQIQPEIDPWRFKVGRATTTTSILLQL